MRDPCDGFLQRMLVTFGEPRTSDGQAFLAEYRRVLAAFPAEVLDKAADDLIAGGTMRIWPTPGACRAAASAAASAAAAKRHANVSSIDSYREKRAMDAAIDAAVVRSAFCKSRSALIEQALREGWSRSLEHRLQQHAADFRRQKSAITLADIDAFRMPDEIVAYLRLRGEKHLATDLEAIGLARAANGC